MGEIGIHQSQLGPKYYNDSLPDGGRRPVWALAPQSVLISPAPEDHVAGPIELRGWAWGAAGVARVEVSDDCGASWSESAVTPRHDRAWQAWSCTRTVLMCRATDSEGRTQSLQDERNCVHRIEVTARPG